MVVKEVQKGAADDEDTPIVSSIKNFSLAATSKQGMKYEISQ